MFAYGTLIRSTRGVNKSGYVVGYGSLEWPKYWDNGDEGIPQAVYIVRDKDSEGSSDQMSATMVFHVEHVEEVI